MVSVQASPEYFNYDVFSRKLRRNVVGHDRTKLRGGVDVLHPLRQLAVPNKSVATDALFVCFGKVDNAVDLLKVEGSL